MGKVPNSFCYIGMFLHEQCIIIWKMAIGPPGLVNVTFLSILMPRIWVYPTISNNSVTQKWVVCNIGNSFLGRVTALPSYQRYYYAIKTLLYVHFGLFTLQALPKAQQPTMENVNSICFYSFYSRPLPAVNRNAFYTLQ